MTEQPAEDLSERLRSSDCTICSDPNAAAIDEALLSGTSIRTVAGTYGLSRSSVGRHRLNHLTAETWATDDADRQQTERRPLRLVDVHGELTALCDRLEKVVELATRTGKAPAAVQAMREQRQALEALARLQADPKLLQAISVEQVQSLIDQRLGDMVSAIIDFALGRLDPEARGAWNNTGLSEKSRIVGELIAATLRHVVEHDGRLDLSSLDDIDDSSARQYREREALAQTKRLEAEVERRVAEELARREAVPLPAPLPQAPQRLAIEGRV